MTAAHPLRKAGDRRPFLPTRPASGDTAASAEHNARSKAGCTRRRSTSTIGPRQWEKNAQHPESAANRQNPALLFRRRYFIGEANLIPCEVVAIDGDITEIAVDDYRYRLASRGLPRGPAKLAVRPARIVLGGDEGFDATVAKATYVGVRMEYSLDTSFGSMFAVQDDVTHPLETGSPVKVSFKPTGPVLIPPH